MSALNRARAREFWAEGISVIGWTALLIFVAVTVLATGRNMLGMGTDETDAGGGQRSGVTLRIDHGTGCHYLETTGGGITPRLDPAGDHICRR